MGHTSRGGGTWRPAILELATAFGHFLVVAVSGLHPVTKCKGGWEWWEWWRRFWNGGGFLFGARGLLLLSGPLRLDDRCHGLVLVVTVLVTAVRHYPSNIVQSPLCGFVRGGEGSGWGGSGEGRALTDIEVGAGLLEPQRIGAGC